MSCHNLRVCGAERQPTPNNKTMASYSQSVSQSVPQSVKPNADAGAHDAPAAFGLQDLGLPRMYDSVAPAKGDGDTRPGVKIKGMLPFARVPTIDRRVPPPSSKHGIQKPPQTDPSKRRVMENELLSLSLSLSLFRSRSSSLRKNNLFIIPPHSPL